jgi:ABC-type transport system substrate-binding protein
MDNLYSSLYRFDPNQHPVKDLASNCTIETHSDNPAVPEGHQRYTIDIIQNATWTDGKPLRARDVALTFTYILESGFYGNPLATRLGDLQSAYTLGPYRVVLEFSTESYWHFEDFAFTKILPYYMRTFHPD